MLCEFWGGGGRTPRTPPSKSATDNRIKHSNDASVLLILFLCKSNKSPGHTMPQLNVQMIRSSMN
jgi:hypothetical protein